MDTAIAALNQILQPSPRNKEALNLLGIALTKWGRLLEADEQYQKALRIDAAFVPAIKNLAGNEIRLRRIREARVHVEQILKNDPENETAHILLAEIYF